MRLALVGLALLVAATSCASPAAETAGLDAESRELAAYLATTYRLTGELLAEQAAAMPSFQDIAEGSPQATAEQQAAVLVLLEDYLAALSAIDPPAGAADFHTRTAAMIEQSIAGNRALQEASGSGDPEQVLQASRDMLALVGELLQESFELAFEAANIVEQVLAGREDPESRYIIELLALRTSPASQLMETIGSQLSAVSTVDEMADLLDTTTSAMVALEADYSAITPPQAWSALHEEQLQLLTDAIDLYSRMADALEDPTEIVELFEELLDFATRVPELSAKLSSNLADYFESLA
ncbi:MAG: hypothetical protein BMS9Abin07_2080 [Acidimicrobiia bacterium]|nr:MAG: hypothetical protein BMS9Abin07_2080 [Acidimicrobiia bacterium]